MEENRTSHFVRRGIGTPSANATEVANTFAALSAEVPVTDTVTTRVAKAEDKSEPAKEIKAAKEAEAKEAPKQPSNTPKPVAKVKTGELDLTKLKKKNKKQIQINTQLTQEQVEILDKTAQKYGTSRSELIRAILTNHIDNYLR